MRRSTIIYLVLFAVVLGAAYYFNNRPEPASIEITLEPDAPIEYLFTLEDGIPNRIRIDAKSGESVEVARNAEDAWVVILPEETAADQGSVEAAVSQVSTMRILERVPSLNPEAVGLDVPEYKMILQFTSGVERTIEIGVITPTERGYYVRDENNEIMIVSKATLDSLLGLLTTPPYAPTETPVPTTSEAGSVSEETATPQP